MFSFNGQVSLDTLIQVASLVVVVVTFLWAQRRERLRHQESDAAEHRRDREIANREIYQRLELASIDLFRFEADHVDVIRPLWEPSAVIPEEHTAEHVVLMDYVCQLLNLFEMAVRFRRDGVVPPDVFGSWVTWLYDVCQMPGFVTLWRQNRSDYTFELRRILDAGTRIASSHKADREAGRREFFELVSGLFDDCVQVRDWLRTCEDETIERERLDHSLQSPGRGSS